jgi:hypothetical protein
MRLWIHKHLGFSFVGKVMSVHILPWWVAVGRYGWWPLCG